MDLQLLAFAYQHYGSIDNIIATTIQVRGEKVVAIQEEVGAGRRRIMRDVFSLDNYAIFNIPVR